MESNFSSQQCASALVDVIPQVMRIIRTEMRSFRDPNLTIPEFRTMVWIEHHPGKTISDAAEHVGVGLPTMSKIIEHLVQRDYVTRRESLDDRRCMALDLTQEGAATLKNAHQVTQQRLAARLENLTSGDRQAVVEVMQLLKAVFSATEEIQV